MSPICEEAAAVSKDGKDLGHPHRMTQEEADRLSPCALRKVTSLPRAGVMALYIALLGKAPSFRETVFFNLA